MVAIIRSCVGWVPAQGVSFISTGERKLLLHGTSMFFYMLLQCLFPWEVMAQFRMLL